MKLARICLVLGLCFVDRAQADLSIVQRVDGVGQAPGGNVTIRIKGDKAKVDVSPQVSTIVNGKTGEIITLMKDQKRAVRISAEKMKAAAEMLKQFSDKKTDSAPAKPKPTGRKETIDGYEAEEYTMETPLFKASYWLAPKYPDGAAILKQLRAVKSDIWSSANSNMPDYRDFPALPIRTVLDLNGTKVTTTLVSAKQEVVSDDEFSIPKDFQEIKSPELGSRLHPGKAENAPGTSPHP